MANRYKITFEGGNYAKNTGYQRYAYTICTCLDERKALVMATYDHMDKQPDDRIFRVLSVETLTGTEAESTDIVDRMEY